MWRSIVVGCGIVLAALAGGAVERTVPGDYPTIGEALAAAQAGDIILIEPRSDDYQMSFYNIMRYSARLTVARHGFESVTLDLAEDYQRYKKTLAQHGIPISRRLVVGELQEIQQSGYDPDVIQRILEARPATCHRRGRGTPVCQLARTLAELDMELELMAVDEIGA